MLNDGQCTIATIWSTVEPCRLSDAMKEMRVGWTRTAKARPCMYECVDNQEERLLQKRERFDSLFYFYSNDL